MQYSPKAVIRHISPEVMEAYLTSLTPELGGRIEDPESKLLVDHWDHLGEPDRARIEVDLRNVYNMADEQGIQCLLEEARGFKHRLDLTGPFANLPTFSDRALWTITHHPKVFRAGLSLRRADSLPKGSWQIAGGLQFDADYHLSEELGRKLGAAISAFFVKTDGRGHRVTVDRLLRERTPKQHFVFVYLDDFSSDYVGHDDDGVLVRRPLRPAFEVVFAHEPTTGLLRLHAKGNPKTKQFLLDSFAQSILDLPAGAATILRRVFDLDPFKSKDLALPTDPEDRIQEVRVTRLRLVPNWNERQHVILEPDPSADRNDIYDMVDRYIPSGPNSLEDMTVTKVSLRFTIHGGSDEEITKLDYDISLPNYCSLRTKSGDQQALGEKYLRRWGIFVD
jgi:hypothetical protein